MPYHYFRPMWFRMEVKFETFRTFFDCNKILTKSWIDFWRIVIGNMSLSIFVIVWINWNVLQLSIQIVNDIWTQFGLGVPQMSLFLRREKRKCFSKMMLLYIYVVQFFSRNLNFLCKDFFLLMLISYFIFNLVSPWEERRKSLLFILQHFRNNDKK